MAGKPVMLSGVKPSGELHIGNYFGAMRQFVDLANSGKYETYVMVADYHALNTIHDADEMRERIREVVMAYLAIGLDPNQVTIFKQSDVSAHTELAWIFDTITTIPYLARGHAFKAALGDVTDSHPAQRFLADKLEQLPPISVGTFNYPMLMAADILLYDAEVVPVGQDQKQHIEFARDTARKFNNIFGQTKTFPKTNILKIRDEYDIFKLPKEYIMPEVAVVPGTDGQKMSKSYGNVIPLFASREELAKAVMSIVTDSSGEKPAHVYAIHKLVKSESELEPLYAENKGNYKALKEALIEDLDRFFAPIRTKYEALKNNPGMVEDVLAKGKERARGVAEAKMTEVRKAIGVAY